MAFLKYIGLALVLSAVSGWAQTNTNTAPYYARYPIRGFGGASVNLTPLIEWWNNQVPNQPSDTASRPLTAWKRVVGMKISDMGMWWVVDAEIFTNQDHGVTTRIILKNPPVQDEQAFYALQQQIVDQGTQLTNIQASIQSYQQDAKTNSSIADTNALSPDWRQHWYATAYYRRSANDRIMAHAALPAVAQTKQAIETTTSQLNSFPSFAGHYQIDLLALATGQFMDGLPVYDLGTMYTTAQ